MDSKKLGMFAAAALTVLAAQANAKEAKKDAKAAAAKGEMVCTNACGTEKHKCAGYELKADATTKAACDKVSGKWMTKSEHMKKVEEAKNTQN